MKEIQERYAADKQRQQQEMLKLYQTEKINPVAGCVPILLQIPVFYALYKVLTVTIEMRHAPFFGWIHDLSARDPTSIFNLFGLLPLSILACHSADRRTAGARASGRSSTASPCGRCRRCRRRRPTRCKRRSSAGCRSCSPSCSPASPPGLVIYWTWSNIALAVQQYVIMRRQGVETQLDKFLASGEAAAAE